MVAIPVSFAILQVLLPVIKSSRLTCSIDDPRCSSERGGTYQPQDSRFFGSLGDWQLGQPWLGYGGNGAYGLDTLNFYAPLEDLAVGMSNVVVAAFNSTSYFNGFFGLGVTAGNFGKEVAESPLVQMVRQFGWIPSYSYGYTAGAWYRNEYSSVVLGGYDASRFKENGVTFTIANQQYPKALVRGIEVTADKGDKRYHADSKWKSSTQVLSTWDQRFVALIDSTTPYLWLPESICDNFANALGFKYNDTFDLYILDNDQYNTLSDMENLAFTFSLSSYDNQDNFGHPLHENGVVNITLPSVSFISTLQFPFQNESIEYGAPAVPYFTLRKSHSNDSIILGRSFLQEAYLVTKYDSDVFSLYQTEFPSGSPNVQQIARPDDSIYPEGPPETKHNDISTGEKAGIAVGVILVIFSVISFLSWYCCCRGRKEKRAKSVYTTKAASKLPVRSTSTSNTTAPEMEEQEESISSIASHEPPRTIRRILTRISRNRMSRRGNGGKREKAGPVNADPVVSEIPDSEIYELPAPIPPVELNGIEEDEGYDLDDSAHRSESTQENSSYEVTRRRMERQLQGPVPEYTPPLDGRIIPSEKHAQGGPTSAPNLHGVEPSPISNHGSSMGDGTGSFPPTLPSPISPHDTGSNNWFEGVSPITTTTPTFPRLITRSSAEGMQPAGGKGTSIGRTNSDAQVSPISSANLSMPSSTMAIQRTPIDTSRVVFLGRLPDHYQPPGGRSLPRIVEPPHGVPSLGALTMGNLSQSSLGSNFTEEEQEHIAQMTQHSGSRGTEAAGSSPASDNVPTNSTFGPWDTGTDPSVLRPPPAAQQKPSGLRSQERIDPALELIHVPQMADKRYSWEEER